VKARKGPLLKSANIANKGGSDKPASSKNLRQLWSAPSINAS